MNPTRLRARQKLGRSNALGVAASATTEPMPPSSSGNKDEIPLDLEANLETGFQIATFQGPLCAEPVEGMAYFVEDIEYDPAPLLDLPTGRKTQVGGSIITASKEVFRSGLLDWSPRLKLAIYSCDIQASSQSFSNIVVFYHPSGS